MDITPQEKAKQLVSGFAKINKGNDYYVSKYRNGCRAALLCAKEVVKSTDAVEFKKLKYWLNVVKELEDINV